MAEFQVVAKELERMCNTYHAVSCGTDECPLYYEDLCYAQAMVHVHGDDACMLERVVMSWAAENPEPVYPMWVEWLADKGMVDVARMPVDYSGGIITEIKPSGKMYERIPADIAEKLGLKPKEG